MANTKWHPTIHMAGESRIMAIGDLPVSDFKTSLMLISLKVPL